MPAMKSSRFTVTLAPLRTTSGRAPCVVPTTTLTPRFAAEAAPDADDTAARAETARTNEMTLGAAERTSRSRYDA
jgi:hypothetical protein